MDKCYGSDMVEAQNETKGIVHAIVAQDGNTKHKLQDLFLLRS